MNNFKKGEISMDIKIEKENAFSIIVKTKQFNEETSFDEVPKYWDEYYEQGFQMLYLQCRGFALTILGI